MRLIFALLLFTSLTTLAWAEDPGWTIRPVQVISQAAVPEGAPSRARTVMFNTGFSIGYLIEGDGIVGIDTDSLVVDQILMPGGKDITKKRNGKDNYAIGAFPEISDDGKFCFFQVTSEEHVFGKAESLEIHGSIGVRTASDLKTVTSKSHALDGAQTEKLDEFSVLFGTDPKEKVPTFVKNDMKDKASITITGPIDKINEIVLVINNKEIKSEESFSVNNDARCYGFPRPAEAAQGLIRIKFWKDLKLITVHFPKK